MGVSTAAGGKVAPACSRPTIASHTNVDLAAANGHLAVSVRDDGVGLLAGNAGNPTGTGLVNLRDRVEALGGVLHVEPGDGGGTCVRAELPVGARDG